ncbi:NAD(P)H-hydrate dehydratase [Thioflexithrix psekupsensis]|uniref:Bifunctional NAD(P)H-hydrate repair enzyme n=1 Tax=Thioflexithrix psekupsensis TaxID=1570016 RepID=A0A251X7I4_9GAMM|nr:NAD(P)H-hydrate dehydratase [Thioflexithrix psekupsensis]OUD13941.1 bifunctional ADP-dependent (S)-NAD(P)H-hydrate dehydratase/NAD(P)H-hydrate epimerase [Thioflexithrix psekupsensis]
MTLSNALPLALYRSGQVRELDRVAIEEMGIPGICLMERAGAAAFNLLQQRWLKARRIIVVCGVGNNGGDGYVVARLAYLAGYDVTVLQLGDTTQLKGEALAAYEAMTDVGLFTQVFAEKKLSIVDLIVDALLGTGLDREVSGQWRQVIEAINRSKRPILSLDIPSGLHADTGTVLGVAIQATATMSFVGLKQGLFTGEGPAFTGQVYFNDLQIPAVAYKHVKSIVGRIEYDVVKTMFVRRSRIAHKGSYGHVLVIGGAPGMLGAVCMAAEAAARVGAGKVTVATHPSHAALVSLHRPEIMSYGVETTEALMPLVDQADVVAIGPGLGQSIWARALLDAVKDLQKPVVADADALNLMAQTPFRFPESVLTPHPGEAARLLEMSTVYIQSDRFHAVKSLQLRFGGVCVLKGAGTLIADEDGKISVCTNGNPGMATGGMGDVLTGVIVSLLGQGYTINEAARLGVCLHARAADKAAESGERGLLATDLFTWLRYYANPELF